METNRQTVARFRTVQWRWMAGELVDDCEQIYEIYRTYGQLFVRTPQAIQGLGAFLRLDPIGRRVRYLYQQLDHQRLEALHGAILDLYPRGSARVGYRSIGIEGGELHGQEF